MSKTGQPEESCGVTRICWNKPAISCSNGWPRRLKAVGADAVIGMRLVTSNVAEGAAELIGYGTAVRFLD